MTRTVFRNASGLPHPQQKSTARDLSRLATRLIVDFPQYYSYFSRRSFTFAGRTHGNHNRLLGAYPGMDGLKTGYTRASGFNLAASAVRDGRRLIAVVLGGASTAQRDENVEDLLNAGFEVLAKRKAGENITIAATMREPDDLTGLVMRPAIEQGSGEQDGLKVVVGDDDVRGPIMPAPGFARTPLPAVAKAERAKASEPARSPTAKANRGGYRIQVGAFANRKDANAHLKKISSKYATLVASGEPEVQSASRTYRVRFAGFSESGAKKACSGLKAKGVGCLVVAPS
jgi:D-alanyl-D-alanine carboxypeptidase